MTIDWSFLMTSLVFVIVFVGALLYDKSPVFARFRLASLERSHVYDLPVMEQRIIRGGQRLQKEITQNLGFFLEALAVAHKVRTAPNRKAMSQKRVIVDRPIGLVNRSERRRLKIRFVEKGE